MLCRSRYAVCAAVAAGAVKSAVHKLGIYLYTSCTVSLSVSASVEGSQVESYRIKVSQCRICQRPTLLATLSFLSFD